VLIVAATAGVSVVAVAPPGDAEEDQVALLVSVVGVGAVGSGGAGGSYASGQQQKQKWKQ